MIGRNEVEMSAAAAPRAVPSACLFASVVERSTARGGAAAGVIAEAMKVFASTLVMVSAVAAAAVRARPPLEPHPE